MPKPAHGPPKSLPLGTPSEHAHLATPPDMIRWDLGERPTLDTPKERLCVVQIGGRILAIEGRYSRGVQDIGEPTPIPLAPNHILGLCHVRGKILPAVDLELFFDPNARKHRRSSPALPSRNALILEVDQVEFCLVVDEVVAFEPFDMDRLQALDDENDPWSILWAGQTRLDNILEPPSAPPSDPPSDSLSSDRTQADRVQADRVQATATQAVPVLDLQAAVATLRFGQRS